MILKPDDIITAEMLCKIIEAHGADFDAQGAGFDEPCAGLVSIDGSIFEPYADASDLGVCQEERFRVILNYGHEVQFHLLSDTCRAIVTTGLSGQCDDMEGWIAEANIDLPAAKTAAGSGEA